MLIWGIKISTAFHRAHTHPPFFPLLSPPTMGRAAPASQRLPAQRASREERLDDAEAADLREIIKGGV